MQCAFESSAEVIRRIYNRNPTVRTLIQNIPAEDGTITHAFKKLLQELHLDPENPRKIDKHHVSVMAAIYNKIDSITNRVSFSPDEWLLPMFGEYEEWIVHHQQS